jgi:hypothetical protein
VRLLAIGVARLDILD